MSRSQDFPTGEGHKPYYSVSKYKTMKDCPYRYWLERVEKVWQRPAAWFAHGTAFHTAAEEFERSGRTLTLDQAQDAFRDAYVAGINEATSETPNMAYWFSSGHYKGAADVERRFEIGLEQVTGYLEYYSEVAPREVIWITPDGTPAIELAFDVEFGGIRVVGYIDQVPEVQPAIPKPKSKSKAAVAAYEKALAETAYKPIPRDLKSGSTPGDAFQLGTYSAALDVLYGLRADTGDYWMAGTQSRKAGPTRPYDLTDWTPEAVGAEFQWLDQEVRAERFDPTPGPQCRRCSVADSCDFSQV
ncbi:RecB family exonuclease [Amycolatopsis sp. NPDC059027]|uniref:RecB family exonuclease n=1 Tax=Amycolatopsis sp. NPDC059027 TaxID=3346709 RepID=UPI00366FBF90